MRIRRIIDIQKDLPTRQCQHLKVIGALPQTLQGALPLDPAAFEKAGETFVFG